MMSKKAMKIICIILAAIMALSVFAIVIQILAVDEAALAVPATGESVLPYVIPAVVIAIAVIAILCAVLIPKLKSKKEQ